MLTQLSFTAGTPHPKVLERGSEPAQLVTREMGDADQDVGHGNGMGNRDDFENGFVDSDLHSVISPQAVRDDDGGIDHRKDEAILVSSGHMRDRLYRAPT
jgi:hypothetical protein